MSHNPGYIPLKSRAEGVLHSNAILAVATGLSALRENHEHHKDYDDYGGYPGSDMAQTNLKAIASLEQTLEELTNAHN